MTLKEAVATGKRFRRKNVLWYHQHDKVSIPIEDAVADDWEVERVKKEGWINIYPPMARDLANVMGYVGEIYATKDQASDGGHENRVATIKIEWEE